MTEATTIASSGTGTNAVGEYCLVSGIIKPVDPTAPNNKFQLGLPKNWNTKALMLGGEGFNGVIPDITGNVPRTHRCFMPAWSRLCGFRE